MKTVFIFVILSVGVVFSAADVSHKDTSDTQQSNCPVMGGEIDSTLFTVYDGETVYFCCAGCISLFESNPEEYQFSRTSDPASDAEKKR